MNPYIYPLFAVLAWGANFALIKVLAEYLPSHAMNVLRTLIAAVFYVLLWRFRQRLSWRDLLIIGAVGLLGNGMYQQFFLEAVPRIPASLATLTAATSSLWVALLGAVWLGERLSGVGFLGVGLSFVGIVLLTWGGANEFSPAGVVYGLLAALVWALYSLASRPYSGRYHLLSWVGVGYVLGMSPYWLAHAPGLAHVPQLNTANLSAMPLWVWLGIAVSALMANTLAYLAWVRGIQLLGAVRVSVFSNLTPIIGVAGGMIFLGERLSGLVWLAGALTLVGVVITQRSKAGGG
jgi:drug/metabolite transporter (DMT)-like permease